MLLLRRLVAAALPLFLIQVAWAAVPTPAPGNLRVSDFNYNSIAKVHRFTFEWDPAKQSNGRPFDSYALSSGKGCGYETLNAGDTITGHAAMWVVKITGPRYGVTVVCGCPRRTMGYTGVVKTASAPNSAPAYLTPAGIPVGHRWPDPRYPYNIVLACV